MLCSVFWSYAIVQCRNSFSLELNQWNCYWNIPVRPNDRWNQWSYQWYSAPRGQDMNLQSSRSGVSSVASLYFARKKKRTLLCANVYVRNILDLAAISMGYVCCLKVWGPLATWVWLRAARRVDRMTGLPTVRRNILCPIILQHTSGCVNQWDSTRNQ